MHLTKIQDDFVTLFQRGGNKWKFTSIKDFIQKIGYHWANCNVAKEFKTYLYTEYRTKNGYITYSSDCENDEIYNVKPIYNEADFILRNGNGDSITERDLYAETLKRRRTIYQNKFLCKWLGFGPVPGTGKQSKKLVGHKNVKHIRTARAYQSFEDEKKIKTRYKSTLRSILHDDCDDYYRDIRKERSWKKYRESQWKINKHLNY
jgi:hypothetical protein